MLLSHPFFLPFLHLDQAYTGKFRQPGCRDLFSRFNFLSKHESPVVSCIDIESLLEWPH